MFEDFGERLLPGEMGDDVFLAMGVSDGEESKEPDRAWIGEWGHGTGLLVFGSEVFEGNAVIGVESAVINGVRESAGGVEIAERVAGEVGVPPDPKEAILKGSDLDGVKA